MLVYALAERASGRIAIRGIAGEPLRAVRIGAIDAVIGRASRIPKPTEHNLRKHGRIISALWRRTSALLPARFGTSVADVAELEVIVGTREKTLRRTLRSVRNRAQMTVRMLPRSGTRDSGLGRMANPSSVSGSRIPNPESRIPDPESRGHSYLHARVADAQRARDVPGFAPLRRAVKTWVRAERVEKRGRVATIYHLVPRGSADRYRAALERAAGAASVRMLVSGPWPPYAFAESW
jgi:gas vesicle protein GvpL/GvpF